MEVFSQDISPAPSSPALKKFRSCKLLQGCVWAHHQELSAMKLPNFFLKVHDSFGLHNIPEQEVSGVELLPPYSWLVILFGLNMQPAIFGGKPRLLALKETTIDSLSPSWVIL